MFISKTPFRVSFAGGGSDMRVFYANRPGAVLSTAIDKYMYVTVNRRFEKTIRVSYTKTEIVERLEDLQHEIIRAGLMRVGIDSQIEVTTVADIPAGTGMGSSSSLTVGLLKALYAYVGKHRSAEELGREASEIEIETLNKSIGKQDQYAAAYGGLNFIRFHADETVMVDPIVCRPETKRELQDRIVILFTGLRGENEQLLNRQKKQVASSDAAQRVLAAMVERAQEMKSTLEANDLDSFGEILHSAWELKKQVTAGISTGEIDTYYNACREAGAIGGKLLGAGGSGFLLMYCRQGAQDAVRAVGDRFGLRNFDVRFDGQGSRIIYVGESAAN
jgi:D-glycero-alpha-D-manno-heptose-7-phosphate kinase